MFRMLSVFLVLGSVSALSAVTPSTLPRKAEAVYQLLKKKMDVVPEEHYARAAVVIAKELEKKEAGRSIDQSAVNWALDPIFKTLTTSLTNECTNSDDCTVQYTPKPPKSAEVSSVPQPSKPAVTQAFSGALAAIGYIYLAKISFVAIGSRLITMTQSIVAAIASTGIGARGIAAYTAAGGAKAILAAFYATATHFIAKAATRFKFLLAA